MLCLINSFVPTIVRVNTLCTILFIAFTTKCGGVLLTVQCILCGSWIARINSRIKRQHVIVARMLHARIIR